MSICERFRGLPLIVPAGDGSSSCVLDTLPGWWTFVIDPSPNEKVAGDHYELGTQRVLSQFVEWDVTWMPRGDDEEALERERFGWRPLRGPVSWLT